MARMPTNEDFAKFKCHSCAGIYDLERMYACKHGRQICKTCYVRKREGDSKPTLNMSSTTIGSTGSSASDSQNTDDSLSSSKMFPESVLSRQQLIEGSNSVRKVAMLLRTNIIKLTVSNKPVLCPQFTCRQILAVSGIDTHFIHEHVDVYRLCVKPETVNMFELDIKSFEDMQTPNICLSLFYVNDSGVHSPQASIASGHEEAVRLGLTQTRQCFIVALAKIPVDPYTATGEPYNNHGDKVTDFNYLFYTMSTVRHNYTYSIGISTKNNEYRFRYTGTLTPLSETYQKICNDCNGLVITSRQMNYIKEKSGPIVMLNLVMHRCDGTFALSMERAIEMSERDFELDS